MDLILSFAGETGSVALGGQLSSEGAGVDRIEFADGSSWTREELLDAAMAGIVADAEPATAGGDSLDFPADRSAVAPGAGNDYLTATASGTATIVFAKGDGDDQLQNYASSIVRHDSLLLAGILPHEIELQRSGDTLIINIVGTGDSFSALDQFKQDPDGNFGLEQIVFADGLLGAGTTSTTWWRSAIWRLSPSPRPRPQLKAVRLS